MKSTVSYLYIERRLKSQEHRLNGPVANFSAELDALIGDQVVSAPDDEARNVIIDDEVKKRPHYIKQIADISSDDLERAFGTAPTLKAQGDLVVRYGDPSVAAAAARWNASLGSLKPGRDPDAAPGDTKSRKKAAAAADDVPPASKNPFSPDWKCSRPVSSPAEKETLRHEAMTAVIKNFGTAGAARFAKSVGMTIAGTPLRR